MISLQNDLNVHHKSGKEILVADTLSRLQLKDPDDTHEASDVKVHNVMTNLPISDTKISGLQAKTRDDPALQLLIRIIQIVWRAKKYRDELKVIDEQVLKGERIVIPTAARREMLKRIHVGNMGIVKCKNRTK